MDKNKRRKLETEMLDELVSDIKQFSEKTEADSNIDPADSRSKKSFRDIVKTELDTDNDLSDTDDGYSLEKYDLSFAIKSEGDTGLDIERSILEDTDVLVSKENDFIKMEADIYESNDNSLDIVGSDDSFFSLGYTEKIDKEFGGKTKSDMYSNGSRVKRNASDISNEMDQKEESSFDYGNDTDSYDEEDFANEVIIKREINDDQEDVKTKVVNYGRKTKKAKDHICDMCNKAFTSNNRLKRHKEQLHADGSSENKAIKDGKYICEVCDKRFISQSRLNLHAVTHTGEKPFSCDVCGQKFSHPTNKRRHMKAHTGDKPFVCMFCGKSYPVKHYLTDHLVKHTGEKPHQCKLCSVTFAHRFSLKQHMLLKHPGGELNYKDTYKDRPFSCEICGKRFTQQSSLKIHVRLHTGSKPYKCSECNASFIRSDSLLRHKFEHSGQRPFQCDMCDKAFTSGYILKQHRNVHTGDRRQQCEHCGVELANKESLSRHMLRHTGESMLECGMCRKKFIHKQSLMKHQETPCEEKMYECKSCNYKSNSESKLKRHMLKHNAPKLLECKICKNKFTYPSNLTRHMKVHEKDHLVKTKSKETIISNDDVEHFIAVSVKEIDKDEYIGVTNMGKKMGKRPKKSVPDCNKKTPSFCSISTSETELDNKNDVVKDTTLIHDDEIEIGGKQNLETVESVHCQPSNGDFSEQIQYKLRANIEVNSDYSSSKIESLFGSDPDPIDRVDGCDEKVVGHLLRNKPDTDTLRKPEYFLQIGSKKNGSENQDVFEADTDMLSESDVYIKDGSSDKIRQSNRVDTSQFRTTGLPLDVSRIQSKKLDGNISESMYSAVPYKKELLSVKLPGFTGSFRTQHHVNTWRISDHALDESSRINMSGSLSEGSGDDSNKQVLVNDIIESIYRNQRTKEDRQSNC